MNENAQSKVDDSAMSHCNHKSDLISLLNLEIEQLRHQEQEPGWSKWAVLGGIATCVWLVISEFEKPFSPAWSNIISIFGGLYFLKEAIKSFNIFALQSEAAQQARFFPVKNFGHQIRQLCVFDLLFLSTLFFLLGETPNISVSGLWTSRVYVVLQLISALAVFISSYTNFSIPNLSSFGFSRIQWVSLFHIGFLTYILYEYRILIDADAFNISELKIAILIFSGIFLSEIFIKSGSHTPLLKRLGDLRRDLMMGTVHADIIRPQVEIALRGLRVSHLLQDEIDIILAYSKELGSLMENQKSELGEFERLYKIDSSSVLTEALMNSMDSRVAKVSGLLDEYAIAFRNFKKRSARLLILAPNIRSDLIELNDLISNEFEDFSKKHTDFSAYLISTIKSTVLKR